MSRINVLSFYSNLMDKYSEDANYRTAFKAFFDGVNEKIRDITLNVEDFKNRFAEMLSSFFNYLETNIPELKYDFSAECQARLNVGGDTNQIYQRVEDEIINSRFYESVKSSPDREYKVYGFITSVNNDITQHLLEESMQGYNKYAYFDTNNLYLDLIIT